MVKREVALPIIALAALAVLVFVFMRIDITGNVILDTETNFVNGESLAGILTLSIEKGDSLRADSIILVAIRQNSVVLESQTLTIGEFINKSDNPVGSIERNEDFYYEQIGSYKTKIQDIVNFNFPEAGEYELVFSILSLDINQRQKIIVK